MIKKELHDTTYQISVDNVSYNIPVSQIYNFLSLNKNEIKNICLDKSQPLLYGIPKEHFIYTCLRYIEKNRNLITTPGFLSNISMLKYNEVIDLQALNQDLKPQDAVYNIIPLDDELKSFFIDGIPHDLSKLEQAIYLYISMCQKFTYNREYFALNQNQIKTIDNIRNINKNNLEIVCFEFVVIYAQLLHEIGINFRSYYGQKQGKYELRFLLDDGSLKYGQNHAFIEFRVDKFLIDADSTSSIIEGDLLNAKIYDKLRGLDCLNENRETQEEFQKILNKVYTIYQTNHPINKSNTNYELLKLLSIEDRFKILYNEAINYQLTGVDFFSYLVSRKKQLYTLDELSFNISLNIVKNNMPEEGKEADIILIITINNNDFSYADNNDYYLCNTSRQLSKTDKKNLTKLLSNHTFEYIKETDEAVPGIETEGIKLSKKKNNC